MAKVLFFIFLMFWIRVTLPRMRVDRLMNFAWKYLVPLAIVNILVGGVWYEIVIRPGRCFLGNWIWGTVVTGPIVCSSIWLVFWLNRGRRAQGAAGLGLADGRARCGRDSIGRSSAADQEVTG